MSGPGLVARVAASLKALAGMPAEQWFGPQQPLPPSAPESVRGRRFDFPAGYNLATSPRTAEPISFADLRALADGYDLLRLAIETRKDQMAALSWQVRPVHARRTDPDALARAERVLAVLARPDQDHGWDEWLRMLLEDLLVLDAPTLYVRRTLAGQPFAFEPIDGATVKRVLDPLGRTPEPPDPAYQQVLKGLPAVDYTADELVYAPRNPRPGRVYGFSPVEQVVMTVNIALRRQLAQLQYYTEGNIPEALIGVPADWSPEQIGQFQQFWDAMLEGNTAERRHAKFVPGEVRITPLREPMLKDAYDEWLARVVCYAFSIPPTAFVGQVNRATAETAQETALSEGLAPLKRWVARLVHRLIAIGWGWDDLEFVWIDTPAIDPMSQAQIDQIYLAAGVKTPAEVRLNLGLSPADPHAADPNAAPDAPQPQTKVTPR